jgi:hypothetical protein
VSVFLEFLEKDRFASVTVDADQSEALVKLLDCVVIKLEGGTEFDLEILEQVVTQVQQQQQSEPPPRTKELAASSKQDEGSFTPPPRGLPTEERLANCFIVPKYNVKHLYFHWKSYSLRIIRNFMY